MTERKNKFAGKLARSKSEPIAPAQETAAPGPVAKSGRQKGRTHPDIKANYVSTTVYIARHVHKQTKGALLDDGRDLSELVEDLLHAWLEDSKPESLKDLEL